MLTKLFGFSSEEADLAEDVVQAPGRWWSHPSVIVAVVAALGGLGTALVTKLSWGDDKRCHIYVDDMLEVTRLSDQYLQENILYLDTVGRTLETGKARYEEKLKQYLNYVNTLDKDYENNAVTLPINDLMALVSPDHSIFVPSVPLPPIPPTGSAVADKMRDLTSTCPTS